MKTRGILPVILMFLCGYFFLFPRISGKEFTIKPEFAANISPHSVIQNGGSSASGIQSGGRTFFLNEAGRPVHYQEGESIASDDGWWAVRREDAVETRAPDGQLLARISVSANPYSLNGQLFLIRDNDSALSKVNPLDGTIQWKREFISRITALDSKAGRTLIGLLDGRCLLIEDSGEVLLQYRPGQSRIEVIYGGALSSDGRSIALVAGLDPQHRILLTEGRDGFELAASYPAEVDFRRPVFIRFINSDNLAVYEAKNYIFSASTENYTQKHLDPVGTPLEWIEAADLGGSIMLGWNDNTVILTMFTTHNLTLFKAVLPSDMRSMKAGKDKIFLIGQDRYAVLRIFIL